MGRRGKEEERVLKSGFFFRAQRSKNLTLLFSLSSSLLNSPFFPKKKTDDYLDLVPISKKNNYTRVAVSALEKGEERVLEKRKEKSKTKNKKLEEKKNSLFSFFSFISLPSSLLPNFSPTSSQVGLSREAPAIFQAHGAYFLLTSGCTGWAPNAAEVFVADHPLSQNWTSLGAPMSGSTPAAREKTFYSQPAFVVPAPGGPEGAFVYMGDAWNKEDLGNSRYVWLPLWVFPPEKGVVIDEKTGKPVTSVPIPDAASALASAAGNATASAVVSVASVETEGEKKERLEKEKADRAKMSADDLVKEAAKERATALAAAAQHGASHAVVLQWADAWHPQDLKGSPPNRPKIVDGRVVDVDG